MLTQAALPNLQHFALSKKKIFHGGNAPDPPNSLICSVFLALTAAGPLQCERLELPVQCVQGFVFEIVEKPKPM